MAKPGKSSRLRADILLVEKGLCESREKARKLILAGKVRLGADRLISKASELFESDAPISVEEPSQYVSRGAVKLLPALDKHVPDLTGLVVFDVGASTGGFTDLALQKNARKVYTVDSGTAQLHGKLRADPKVLWRENTNARSLPDNFLPEKVDLIFMDLSFISATKVIPSADKFLKNNGLAFILVKPQFEAGRGEVGKGGVVRDPLVIESCIENVSSFAKSVGWTAIDRIPSGLKGPKGNQEHFIVFKKL